jgi:hypothetical protein
VSDAIKTARELALLPYTQRTVTERRGGRGRDGGRDGGRDDRGPRGPRPSRDNAETPSATPAIEGDLIDDAGVAAEVLEAVSAPEAGE